MNNIGANALVGEHMGIIRVLTDAVGAVFGTVEGGIADQFLEVIEPNDMGPSTVFTSGVAVRKNERRGGNREGTPDLITDGSIVHVYDNQFMMLVDGGKVVDYTAEPGYFKVSNAAAPSLFHGDLETAAREAFSRIQFGGVPSGRQRVFYLNLQEIKGLRFGTRNAVNYFDTFYNAELFLRVHGTYSIKITDPFTFYREVIPRNADRVAMEDIDEQFRNEFVEALQSAVNRMSADGVRISHVASQARELGRYMSETLDESWKKLRGMEVLSVGIAGLSYDEESQKLINMRNQGAMLSDPSVREGYVQGAMARGVEAAGSNSSGAATGFMGVGMGLQSGGGLGAAFSQSNQAQMNSRPAQPAGQTPAWVCACGRQNPLDAKFCAECGQARPAPAGVTCAKCGRRIDSPAKFCSECGAPLPSAG